MAIGDIRLTNSRYVRPGAYIGFVPQPTPTSPTGTPRYPCLVGRGSRLARANASQHIRARVYGEQLTFVSVAPYIAYLDHNANPDKGVTQLYDSAGRPVPSDKWAFLDNLTAAGYYDRVQISSTTFDKNTTYYIEYQSVDRDVLDTMQFDGVREMLLVGDSEGQNKYAEFVDYRVVTSLVGSATDADALTADTDNTYITSAVSLITHGGGGLGTVAFHASNAYTFPYNRDYTLTVESFGANIAVFRVDITATSGGNAQLPNVVNTSTWMSVDVTAGTVSKTFLTADYAAGYPLPSWFTDDGIYLTFSQVPGAFNPTDTYSWSARAAGKIEFCSAHDNTNQYSDVNNTIELGHERATLATPLVTGQTSGGKININTDSDYNGSFDRSYYLHIDAAIVGVSPNRQPTFIWTTAGELPFTTGSLTVLESATTTRVALESGIYLDFEFGVAHVAVDTFNTLTTASASTLSSAITLANAFKTAYNNHDANAGGGPFHVGGATDIVTAAAASDLASLLTLALNIQTKYTAHLANGARHTVGITATLDTIWSLDSDLTITAASDLAAIVNFLNDAKTKYNRHRIANGFDQWDTWRIDAKAARREFTGKDDRTVTLTVDNVDATTLVSTYTSSNLEGGWATKTLSDFADPWYDLPDNIRLMVRNLDLTGATTATRYAANDVFTFSTLNHDQIDWSLVARASETTAEADIRQDTLGTITGTPLYFYLVMENTPTTVMRVKDDSTGLPISYTWVSDTPYIAFASDPAVDVTVDYEYRGAEPDPGNAYFITANRIRIDSGSQNEYEVPRLFLTRDNMRLGLYPATTDNHLWLAGEICFDAVPFGIYTVQVKSAAGDDTFSVADYRRGIDATETTNKISDVIPIAYFGIIPYAKTSCENMNNPFEAKERLLWVGAQQTVPVGDESTVNTLVYFARRTLQCSPSSPGKGNIILIGNNEATRTYSFEDGSSTSVTLDGSYIAAYTAALVASFLNPSDTIGRKSVSSFDTITTFNEKETVLLGQASITTLESIGTGIYRYLESVTVDTSEPALNEISARTQAHFVTKYVRTKMDETLTYLVPPSPLAGVAIITNQLVQLLGGLASSGIIAPYGSETNPPTLRQINSNSDVYVFADETDKTKYHFGYFFNARYPIKRLFGLYSVDTEFWENPASAA